MDNVWLYNTSLSDDCKPIQNGGALVFYTPAGSTNAAAANSNHAVTGSRQLVIGPLNPGKTTLRPRPLMDVTQTTPTPIVPQLPTSTDEESKVFDIINNDRRLSEILKLVTISQDYNKNI